MNLTKQQIKAIHSRAGNILVNASAGSGKTSVFIARIAELVKKDNVDPSRILALTFSKPAAENMKRRLRKVLTREQTDMLPMSTFHSFAYRTLLKEFPERFGKMQLMPLWWKLNTLRQFTISDSNSDVLNLETKQSTLAEFISYEKNHLVRPGMSIVEGPLSPTGFASKKAMNKIYTEFGKYQQNARYFEFDDMLLEFYYLLKDNAEFANNMRNRYDYIMIDEYQDTSFANNEILKLLSNDNLFCVGDFRQGIYSFINADIDNILKFTKTFNNTTVIELRENFRSTNNIIALSNKIIESAHVDEYKEFSNAVPGRMVDGSDVDLTVYNSPEDEINSIVNEISKLVGSGEASYDQFAILLRTNSNLGDYEEKLTEYEIPADLSSKRSFYDKNIIADMLAYLSLAVNQKDDSSFRRVINHPSRYVSSAFLTQLDKIAYEKHLSLPIAASQVIGRRGKIDTLVSLVQTMREEMQESTPTQLLKYVLRKTNYISWVTNNAKSNNELSENLAALDSFQKFATKFDSVQDLLTRVSLIKANGKKRNAMAVHIMTVHASKGLEYKYVYMPSLLEDNYPHEMSNGNIEEERRLLYVGVTRAKDVLHISYPLFAGENHKQLRPSPFINPLVKDLKQLNRPVITGQSMNKIAL